MPMVVYESGEKTPIPKLLFIIKSSKKFKKI